MSDRCHSLTVVLEKDLRMEDDAQAVISAIGMIRGVLKVVPEVADGVNFMAEQRARSELGRRMLDVIYPKVEQETRKAF